MVKKEDKTNNIISEEILNSLVRSVNSMSVNCACLPDLISDLEVMVELDQIDFPDHKNELLFSTRIRSIYNQIDETYLWARMLKNLLIDIGADPDDFDNDENYFPEIANAVFHGKTVKTAED